MAASAVESPTSVEGIDMYLPSRPSKSSTNHIHLERHGERRFSASNVRSETRIATSTSNPQTTVATGVQSLDTNPNTPAMGKTFANVNASTAFDKDTNFQDLKHYIALGCLHIDQPLTVEVIRASETDWTELVHPELPREVRDIIRTEASRLLEARWIRLFLQNPAAPLKQLHGLIRVYLLPEDWGRRFIDRNSKSLKTALRSLLQKIDISPEAWAGKLLEAEIKHFDPWASAENVSLYYLFNKLPSPNPNPEAVKNRYSRWAIEELIRSTTYSTDVDQPVEGMHARLYPYQARSASLMVQREAAPQLHLDPRLEVRQSPNGEQFFFGARDGSFLKEPRFYESNRGGILAETMGLGKTMICLAVIVATRGHLPQMPATYLPPPRVRDRVGSLKDMTANILSRYAVPAKDGLRSEEKHDGVDFTALKAALKRNVAHYEIPPDIPRMNRTTKIPPPRQLVMCSGTIIVVPRNLLHQWQSEIQKHIDKDVLKVLVMDTIPKRGKPKAAKFAEDMDFRSILPTPTDLMEYDIVLFTRNRFELEIQDGVDDKGRRRCAGAELVCQCPYIGATRMRDCSCQGTIYESPLRKVHWLRIIIDEGHSFSSSMSNAVLVAKQLKVERRWVVSGTPAKNLVGVEMDLTTSKEDTSDPMLLRNAAIEQRKTFSSDDENTKKAAKALGSLASNFLMVRPWSESSAEGGLEWDDHIYRHEHHYQKTFSGFSSCFLRTLEGLVVKTRPGDVEKDITLPPMRHRVVYIKPCWFDKMTANLFIQVLRANAITSERTDVDYLFHKNSIKARHSLIRNLRQSNFTWTGFRLEDVYSTLEATEKYLSKEDKQCSSEDASSLLESSSVVSTLKESASWKALSTAHEVGMAVDAWPRDCEESFSLVHQERPAMIGITQLLDGQAYMGSEALSGDYLKGLSDVGRKSRAKMVALAQDESEQTSWKPPKPAEEQLKKVGVPSSCVGSQPLTSRRASTLTSSRSPQKQKPKTPVRDPRPSKQKDETTSNVEAIQLLLQENPALLTWLNERAAQENTDWQRWLQENAPPSTAALLTWLRERAAQENAAQLGKRKRTLSNEALEVSHDSPLQEPRVVGTTSAKLSYLIGKVMKHEATDKIIIFYDGDNAAYYIAQCLEMLYVNHRIYARTLDNTKRSEYVAAFNEDPAIRVLLIDVACGALGLNLNAASVVLIVNPINRPGIEAQAIKRAHRIGQTKEVLVETLVLEGTIEEAIFQRAKKMSHQQHLEAKELEDDAGIVDIIQNAKILKIEEGEEEGERKFAPLHVPQKIFGRADRLGYHHVDKAGRGSTARKKVKTTAKGKGKGAMVEANDGAALSASEATTVPEQTSRAVEVTAPIVQEEEVPSSSLFGGGSTAEKPTALE